MLHHEGAGRRIGVREPNFKRCVENDLFYSTSHDRLKSAVKRSEKGHLERERDVDRHSTPTSGAPHQQAILSLLAGSFERETSDRLI